MNTKACNYPLCGDLLHSLVQIVHPKYREALQLASAAFKEHAESNPGRLPHIFGSPEYLQVPHHHQESFSILVPILPA